MELQTTQNKSVSIITNKNELLVKELYHINYVVNYPLSDIMLEGWDRTIKELEPEITNEVIKWILDNVKLGFMDWDNKKGIQNIFEGFRLYISYKIKERSVECEKLGIRENLNKWNILYLKYKKNKYDNQMAY